MCWGMGGIKQSQSSGEAAPRLPHGCWQRDGDGSAPGGLCMGSVVGGSPSETRGSPPVPHIPQNHRLEKGGIRLNFVPFNTRVITTIGNLSPTQLCARINWKSIITITNNSLLAFIASRARRISQQQSPRHRLLLLRLSCPPQDRGGGLGLITPGCCRAHPNPSPCFISHRGP